MTVTRPRLQSAACRDAHRLQVGEQKAIPAALWRWLMPGVWKSCFLAHWQVAALRSMPWMGTQPRSTCWHFTTQKMRQQPKPWSGTKMLQNTKACLLSPSSSSTRYDQLSASSSTWTGTEKVGPEVQEVPVWKIRWVSTSFKQSQSQGNFPVKLPQLLQQDFFPL